MQAIDGEAMTSGRRARQGVFPLPAAILVSLALAWAPVPLPAGTIGPAIRVNTEVVTTFELDQRILFLEALRQPGDVPSIAREALINEKLRHAAAKALGVKVADDDVLQAMTAFAARGKLTLDQLYLFLGQKGVDPETARQFIFAQLEWRAVMRAKFGGKIRVTEAEIDRAIAAGVASGGELQVLLSEIFLPYPGWTPPSALAAPATPPPVAPAAAAAGDAPEMGAPAPELGTPAPAAEAGTDEAAPETGAPASTAPAAASGDDGFSTGTVVGGEDEFSTGAVVGQAPAPAPTQAPKPAPAPAPAAKPADQPRLAPDAKPAKNAVDTGPATQPATDPAILAQRIHDGARTLNAFQVFAQKYSSGPTARNGGQLDWLALSALPGPVAAAVEALKPGEMTDPLPVDGGVALYWLRDESEGPGQGTPAMDVDYARLVFPSQAAAAEAAGKALRCGDLYPVARALGQPEMGRATQAESALPADLRGALASMDAGEVRLTPVSGGVELLMLCDRTPQSSVPPSRDAVKSQLANRKLMIMAEGWMQQMRSDAIITEY